MISGVVIKELVTHADESGYLREVIREDDALLERFGQSTVTKAHPGYIKAFHWHKEQDDAWYFANGMALTVLYDRRPDSPTHGETQRIVMGDDKPLLVFIPKGVAHGYKVLGTEPAILVYYTTRAYNAAAPDEERIAYNDPDIGYDWQTKFE